MARDTQKGKMPKEQLSEQSRKGAEIGRQGTQQGGQTGVQQKYGKEEQLQKTKKGAETQKKEPGFQSGFKKGDDFKGGGSR